MIQVYEDYLARGWSVELSHATMRDMGTPDAVDAFLSHLPKPTDDLISVLEAHQKRG